MTILVCPFSKVPEVIVARRPERIVSILDPEYETPDTGPNTSAVISASRFTTSTFRPEMRWCPRPSTSLTCSCS